MLNKRLPKGDNDFRLQGISGFNRAFSNLIRYGKFSSLKDNKKQIEDIFRSLQSTIRRNGKIPYSTRYRMFLKFVKIPGVTRIDERNFKEILDFYK
ncbi:MAG: hypothetical protein WC928_00085 [Patescibacteria group bacterium]|jgi:hypothetical protein